MAFDLKKLSPRERNLIGFLLVTLSTLPFFLYTLPTWNQYLQSITSIKDDEAKIQGLDSRISNLEKLKIENIKLSKKIEAQKIYLAKSYEIDFLVQDLKKLCDESSIALESFTPINPEPVNIVLEKQLQSESKGRVTNQAKLRDVLEKLKGQDLPVDLYRFPIEVKVTGNFTDIIELFKKLEKYGRVISVENISIGKIQAKKSGGNRLSKAKTKKETTDTGSLLSTFDLVAYSLPNKDETLSANELEKSLTISKPSFRIQKGR